MTIRTYAGIGSRKTPEPMLASMKNLAQLLGDNWLLRSGGATGADSAFYSGASYADIHLPWEGYNHCYPYEDGKRRMRVIEPDERILTLAARNHPRWSRLGYPVQRLMARNTTIVLGEKLDQPVDMIVCWAPGEVGQEEGGTSHALRVARDPMVIDAFGEIPIYNLAQQNDLARMVEFLKTA